VGDILDNQIPSGMRKIPKGGDVTSALLKRIIKLVKEERAKPFSKQEEIAFTNNLQQLASDQATLWHRYRHIPVFRDGFINPRGRPDIGS